MQKNSEKIAYAFSNCFKGGTVMGLQRLENLRLMRSLAGLWRFENLKSGGLFEFLTEA